MSALDGFDLDGIDPESWDGVTAPAGSALVTIERAGFVVLAVHSTATGTNVVIPLTADDADALAEALAAAAAEATAEHY